MPVLDDKHLRATFLMTEGLLRLTGFADVKCQLKTRDPLCPAAVLSTGGLRTKSGDLGEDKNLVDFFAAVLDRRDELEEDDRRQQS